MQNKIFQSRKSSPLIFDWYYEKHSFEAFKELFLLSNDILDFSKTPILWNGYDLFEIDGMNLSLSCTAETQNEFGILTVLFYHTIFYMILLIIFNMINFE